MCKNCDYGLTDDDLRFDLETMRKRQVIEIALRWRDMAVERHHRIQELERRPSCMGSWGECDCE